MTPTGPTTTELPIVFRRSGLRRLVSIAGVVVCAAAVIYGRWAWLPLALGLYLLCSAFWERVTVDEVGVAVRTMRTRRVPWSEVRSFEHRGGGLLDGMTIVTDDGAVYAPLPAGNAATIAQHLALLERVRAEVQQES